LITVVPARSLVTQAMRLEMPMNRVLVGFLVAPVLAVAGCGDDQQDAAPADPASASSPAEPEDGHLSLRSGQSVHFRCLGEGEPSMLLEAGTDSGGTELGPWFVDPLAEARRVCSYDRLGTGSSDPAPDHKRTIDDLCDVQDEVRRKLDLGSPAVLAGQSGGANIVIWCASREPASVAALVSIEGYHDDPAVLAAEGFHWRDNPEHVDWVESSVMLDEMPRPIGEFPVLVISATDADPGGVKNQKYWLALSDQSRQVVLQGGHDLQEEVPDQVVAEILDALPAS
jgi:pimeloyl-ACP methyl ester carboxylesterase